MEWSQHELEYDWARTGEHLLAGASEVAGEFLGRRRANSVIEASQPADETEGETDSDKQKMTHAITIIQQLEEVQPGIGQTVFDRSKAIQKAAHETEHAQIDKKLYTPRAIGRSILRGFESINFFGFQRRG
jgi:hypothetical protein